MAPAARPRLAQRPALCTIPLHLKRPPKTAPAQVNSLTDESRDQMWRWRAKDASQIPEVVREEALWLRTRADG